jgi:glycine cleavage system H protein
VSAGEPYAVVESVKAASDVYCPVAGEIAAANTELAASPERINQSPYEAGWIARIRPQDATAAAKLLTPEEYSKLIEAEGD